MFVSIYFGKIRRIEFALKCLQFLLVVKQRPSFGKLEKTKELSRLVRLFFVMTEKQM